ncbi:MAG: nucleotidyltransferase domain-containing protein [Alphaproteobacteria bacterium]|nr:nucleotidyltransferase domain-containing protein [Alphaproteobacteria bacterium]
MKADLTPVRKFKRRAEHALPGRVKKIVLYGSRARGDARRGSDWDIAIFVKGNVASEEAAVLSHIGSDLFFDRGWNIHPMALPAHRESEDSFFLRSLRREGIAV